MKKTIVLLTIVLAILAAPVFAEVGTSGSVDFVWAFGADDNYAEAGEDESSAAITLDGTISDYTSISAEFSADSDDDASLSSLTLTQDVTGALGMSAPVTFAYTLGFMNFEPVDYSAAGPVAFDVVDATAGVQVVKDGEFRTETVDTTTGVITTSYDSPDFAYYSDSSLLGFKLMFGLMDMVNVDVALYPGSMMNKDSRGFYGELSNATEMGINAYGTFGMVDASAYYVSSVYSSELDDDGDLADENGTLMGASIAASPIDGLAVGFAIEHQPKQDMIDFAGNDMEMDWYAGEYALNLGYTLDALSAGFRFASSYTDNEFYEDVTFVQASEIGISAKYMVVEGANVFVDYSTRLQVTDMEDDADIELADLNSYEVGADYTFDGVTYGLSYSLSSDNMVFDDFEFMNEDGDERVGSIQLRVKASF